MNSTTLTITENTTVRATQAAGSALVWNNAITTQDSIRSIPPKRIKSFLLLPHC